MTAAAWLAAFLIVLQLALVGVGDLRRRAPRLASPALAVGGAALLLVEPPAEPWLGAGLVAGLTLLASIALAIRSTQPVATAPVGHEAIIGHVLALARRHNQPFSVLSIVTTVPTPHLRDAILSWVAWEGRRTDVILPTVAVDRVDIASPLTDREQARVVEQRLVAWLRTSNGIVARTGVASFPADGFTLPDLAAIAGERARQAVQKIGEESATARLEPAEAAS